MAKVLRRGENDGGGLQGHVIAEITGVVIFIVAFVVIGAFYANLIGQPAVTQNSSAQSAVSQAETGTFTALDVLGIGLGAAGLIGLVLLIAKAFSSSGSPSSEEV